MESNWLFSFRKKLVSWLRLNGESRVVPVEVKTDSDSVHLIPVLILRKAEKASIVARARLGTAANSYEVQSRALDLMDLTEEELDEELENLRDLTRQMTMKGL